MSEPWTKKLQSRKLWFAVIGALLPILNDTFGWGLDTPTILAAVASLLGFIGSETVLDNQRINAENLVRYESLRTEAVATVASLQAQLAEARGPQPSAVDDVPPFGGGV